MAERLSFADNAAAYASMLSAEHVSRYALVRRLCEGKRVLDIACGEGYGSALMRSWGATEVVGVDISQEAVANATRVFGDAGVRFLQGDASQCALLRDALGTFDLIVSFKTVEHVHDAEGLLRGIKSLSSDGGAIVMSCPNDEAVLSGGPNHFHVRTYSFEAFRDLATGVLGAARSWVVGTSTLGFGAFAVDSRLLNTPPSNLLGLMTGADVSASIALPAQAGHEVDLRNCAYYVGGWNCELPQTSVVAPISFRSYEAPWHNWMACKAEVAQLAAALGEATEDVRRLRIAGEIAAARVREEAEHAGEAARAKQRKAEMAQLDAELLVGELRRHIQQIERSRWHRAGAAYHRLYEVPLLGRVLRMGRRFFGAIYRRSPGAR